MKKNNVKANSLVDICSDVMLHWVLYNVYNVTQKAVLTKLEQIVETYRNLKSSPGRREKILISITLKTSELNAENCLTSNVITRNAAKIRRKSGG